jgi:hypothetical protein
MGGRRREGGREGGREGMGPRAIFSTRPGRCVGSPQAVRWTSRQPTLLMKTRGACPLACPPCLHARNHPAARSSPRLLLRPSPIPLHSRHFVRDLTWSRHQLEELAERRFRAAQVTGGGGGQGEGGGREGGRGGGEGGRGLPLSLAHAPHPTPTPAGRPQGGDGGGRPALPGCKWRRGARRRRCRQHQLRRPVQKGGGGRGGCPAHGRVPRARGPGQLANKAPCSLRPVPPRPCS